MGQQDFCVRFYAGYGAYHNEKYAENWDSSVVLSAALTV